MNISEEKQNIQEDKKKVSCLIPLSTLTALGARGYNQTEAILKGLDGLLRGDDKRLAEDNNNLREENKNIKEDNEKIKGRLKEIQDHNETLKTELQRANIREQNFKEMYNNHVLQVQTLINTRLISEDKDQIKKPWWKVW